MKIVFCFKFHESRWQGLASNIPAMVQIMARCGSGDKPLFETTTAWFTDASLGLVDKRETNIVILNCDAILEAWNGIAF